MSSMPVCDYEGSCWRTEFWPGREYEDRAERIALARLLPPRGQRLCEVGAGFGRLADFYRGYECVLLLDYSHSMLAEARDRLKGDARFVFAAADLYDLPLADSALDTAVTVRVLHHVVNLPRAFSEVARVLRPHGTYVLEYANKRHLKARLRYGMTRREPNPNSLTPLEFVRLNFDFHPLYVESELRAVDCIVQERRAVSTFRMPLLKRIVPSRLLAWADGLLQAPTAGLELAPSMFLRAQSSKPGAPSLGAPLWRCLGCGSTDLAPEREGLTCRDCGRVFPIVDGIIDFKSGRE